MNSNSRKQTQRRQPHRVPSYTNQTAGSNYASHQLVPFPPKDPPYERQTEKEECEIVDLMNAEDYFKRYDLGPILFDLLVTMNVIPTGNDYDFSDLLDIVGERNSIGRFFSGDSFSQATAALMRILHG